MAFREGVCHWGTLCKRRDLRVRGWGDLMTASGEKPVTVHTRETWLRESDVRPVGAVV